MQGQDHAGEVHLLTEAFSLQPAYYARHWTIARAALKYRLLIQADIPHRTTHTHTHIHIDTHTHTHTYIYNSLSHTQDTHRFLCLSLSLFLSLSHTHLFLCLMPSIPIYTP